MIRVNDIYVPLGYTEDELRKRAAAAVGIKPGEITELRLVREAVDARRKSDVHFSVSVELSLKSGEEALLRRFPENKVRRAESFVYPAILAKNREKRTVVVGAGPAGLFAALTLARGGIKPVLLERGADCAERARAVEAFRKSGILDENTNVQFGEGGAGTFSDGKLTTGIHDRRVSHVFRVFAEHGAPAEILYSAKPHIGTDILINVVKSIRGEIVSLGGRVLFGARMTGLTHGSGRVRGVVYERGGVSDELPADCVILAPGHSARDTFEYLYSAGIPMERKIFAVGARIEHLRADVARSLYGSFAKRPELPPAEYKYAVRLKNGRSLYTFCMCPGGCVMAAASEKETVVTNGMSLYARDAENSNSALLVNILPDDLPGKSALEGIYFQRGIERAAFLAGGGGYRAPVTLAGDMLAGRPSTDFGRIKPSYIPGTRFALPESCLPEAVCAALREGLPLLAGKADFFAEPEAPITMPETRSSSPVRIIRGGTLCSPALCGLYPCGEGAGYAGGIVSAAVDGIRCAEAVLEA